MTILTEEERALSITLYGYGRSFQEIAQQILKNRATAIFYPLVKEVAFVVGGRP